MRKMGSPRAYVCRAQIGLRIRGYHDRDRGTYRGTNRKESLLFSLLINYLQHSFSRRQRLGKSPGPFSCLKSPRHAGFRPIGLRVPSRRSASKSAYFRRFPRQSRLLSLFGLRVGAALHSQNQALTCHGSLSTAPAGQASNRATTSRCATQSVGSGLRWNHSRLMHRGC